MLARRARDAPLTTARTVVCGMSARTWGASNAVRRLPVRTGQPWMSKTEPGTIAHKAVEYLRAQPSGTELSSYALADAIGVKWRHFGSYLHTAVCAHMLSKRVDLGVAYWSAPATSAIRTQVPPSAANTLSALAVPSVFAYADSIDAAPFSCALSTDGRMRIERHGRLVLMLSRDEASQVANVAACGVRP